MGCGATKEVQEPLAVRYSKTKMPQPYSSDYENEFEKELFFAINMLRSNPRGYIPEVQRVYQKNLVKGSKSMTAIIAKLKTLPAVTTVKFDDAANAAVRANNVDIIAKAEDAPAEGGNCTKLESVSGASREAKATEASFFDYTGSSAEEFVAILLVKDFDKWAEVQKAKEDAPKEEALDG